MWVVSEAMAVTKMMADTSLTSLLEWWPSIFSVGAGGWPAPSRLCTLAEMVTDGGPVTPKSK